MVGHLFVYIYIYIYISKYMNIKTKYVKLNYINVIIDDR